jgi:Uma2 family endonuclease
MARTAKTAKDLFTFADFRALVPDGQKADLIDGVVYMASPDTDTSDDLTGFVHFLLRGYNYARKLGGQVRGSRYAYRLTKYRAPEPDVGFIGRDRVHLVKKLGMRGGPNLAVEIVSRDSRAVMGTAFLTQDPLQALSRRVGVPGG